MFLEPSSERADLRNAPDASSGFWRSGHRPTLIAAFLYFDLAFMVWVILGPLAPSISADLGLNAAEKGLMVATPTLAGAVLRILMGLLVDRLGPKMTGAVGQVIVILGLFGAWLAGIDSFTGTLALGLLLGFAGASFAVALPLASRWYPREHQGKAMGIAGMGNSGTVLASLFAPGLAKALGWNAVLGLACIPLVIVLAVYLVLAKDSPDCPPPQKLASYAEPLGERDAWWLMLFYLVTFGGFSGLAASLSIYFVDNYGLTPVQAGYAAFGSGDLDKLTAGFTDDITWDAVGPAGVLPIFGKWQGKDQVKQWFMTLASMTDCEPFRHVQYIASGDTVVAAGWSKVTFKSTGKVVDGPFVHVFKFRNGKIASWQGFEDTAADVMAAK